MTAIINVPGYSDRLACESCGCQLAAKRDGEPWRYVQTRDANQWTGIVDVDEPPVHVDIHDGCACHEAYLRIITLP